jgi:hypothetical protein
MNGTTSVATKERLRTILDAYGANPSRWPQDERAKMEAFIHARANEADLNEALAVDRALDAAPGVVASATLSARIMESFDNIASRPSIRRLVNVVANLVWPGAPVWQPSAALAASLIVGLALGVLSPLGRDLQTGPQAVAMTTDVSTVFSPGPEDNDSDP